MNLFKFLIPKPTISDQEVSSGVRWFALEGMVGIGLFNTIMASGLLVAFALALGANNLQIGILAAIPSFMQGIQLLAVWLVERFRKRKAIAVISFFFAQMLWFPIALIPFFIEVPSEKAISLLLILIACRFLFGAITSCSFNSWIRDLIPQKILGQVFSKRIILGTAAVIIFSLGTAFFIDFWQGRVIGQDLILGYTYVILFGALFLGVTSIVFMAMMPEPLMQPVLGKQPSILKRLTTPFRDQNFRKLLWFLFLWGFITGMVTPFFVVYMLTHIGLPFSWVIGLSVLGQLFSISFLRVWGRFVDKFGCKVILSLCASLYFLVVLSWMFITIPEQHLLTMPLLIILHILGGIAGAGLAIAISAISLKLSPQNEATPYLAGSSLIMSLGAGLGPLWGGILADFFSPRQLVFNFTWVDPLSFIQFPVLSIVGFDFLFGITFIFGLVILAILTRIHEKGGVSREVVLESLVIPNQRSSSPMSFFPSNSFLGDFPLGFIKKMPVPGLDVAVGVTIYQIAEVARVVTLATVRGQRRIKKLSRALESSLAGVWKDKKEMKEHGIEITQQVARGAMHVVNEENMDMEKLVSTVTTGVVEVSCKAGVGHLDSISGTSQGIILGAAETGTDISETTLQVIKTVKEMAAQTGISEESAVAKAVEGALQAAEAIGQEAVAEVSESLPK